jgi:S1-C subfamily serine protease
MAASKDLHLVTNAHVAMDAVRLDIRLPSCGIAPIKVEVVGLSPQAQHDIALLRVVQPSELYKLLRERKVAVKDGFVKAGEKLMALGYPEGMPGVKSTLGVMSG